MPNSRLAVVILGTAWLFAGCPSKPKATPDAGPIEPTPDQCGDIDEACCTFTTTVAASCNSPLACRDSSCQDAPDAGTGQPCNSNSDCASGLCLTSGSLKVCTTSCTGANDCIPGWQCGTSSGLSGMVCTCTPSSETCDGLDNDCDGVVDDEPATNAECAQEKAGQICEDGHCQCGATCGGICTDTETDVNNCGGCGQQCSVHSPAAASCALSRCVDTLAFGQQAPGGIAVDSENVYWTEWTDTGAIVKAPLAGGAPVTIATGQYQPVGILVDSTSIYWTNLDGVGQTGAMVMKAPIGGGMPVTVASTQSQPDQLAIDSNNLYWVESGGAIVKLPLGSSTPQTLASMQGTLWGIAIDSNNVYWTNSGSGNIASVPINGGGPVSVVASGLSQPLNIAADGTNIYWTDSGTNVVMKLSLAMGATPVTLAANQQPWGLAVDANNVYWTNFRQSGTVMSVPISGGPTEPITLAEGQWGPLAIVADANALYWTNNGGSTVMRLSPK